MTNARDWTNGPAKWGAAILLAVTSIGGMAWSLSGNRKPVTVTHADRIAARSADPLREASPPTTVSTPPAPAAAPEPEAPTITVPAAPATHLVNLNTATQGELELLPGIGPAMAKRILEYRTQHGKFTSVDQLDAVKGIGAKTMAKLRPLVSVD
jgi:competence protein ComEA